MKVTQQPNSQPVSRRLILGTANFGSRYGLGKSQIEDSEMELIMGEIKQNSNLLIETSPSYHNSQMIIGSYIKEINFERLVVKVPPSEYVSKGRIINSVEDSLSRMNQSKATLVMLHGFGTGFHENAKKLEMACEEIINSKLTSQVGLSCYTEEEILSAKKNLPILTAFQIPENLADGRSKESMILRSMKERGDTFQIRSIFLQGLLTMDINEIPANLKDVLHVRHFMKDEARRLCITEQELCIEYIKQISWMTDVVIGVETYAQLKFNTKAFFNARRLEINSGPTAGSYSVDPRNWS